MTPAPATTTTVDLSADGSTLAYDAGADPAGPPTAIYVGPVGSPAVAVPALAGATVAGDAQPVGGRHVGRLRRQRAGTLRPYVSSSVTGTTSPALDSTSPGQVVQPAITPDGSQVAYCRVGTTGATGLVIARARQAPSSWPGRRRAVFATSALGDR